MTSFLERRSDCHGSGKKMLEKTELWISLKWLFDWQWQDLHLYFLGVGRWPRYHALRSHRLSCGICLSGITSEVDCHHCWDSCPLTVIWCTVVPHCYARQRLRMECCYLSKTLNKHLENIDVISALLGLWDDWNASSLGRWQPSRCDSCFAHESQKQLWKEVSMNEPGK